jgi:hypothetical protein
MTRYSNGYPLGVGGDYADPSDATDYLRGDRTWQTLNNAAVGLSNVDNTSDANKPISSATQSALDAKVTGAGGNASATVVTATGGTTARALADRAADFVNVKEFGAVGDGTTNDTTAIQAAIDAAMQTGKPVMIDGPGPYLITSTLTVKITRDAGPTDTTPANDVHFTDLTSAHIVGRGMPTLKAGASMSAMMELIFDTGDSDVGPFYSRVEGIGFDGNAQATTGLKSNSAMHVTIQKNRFWGLTRGIEFTGYGVARITENVIRATNGIYLVNGGGDSVIHSNDLFAAANNSACIYLGYYSGNLVISSNTFTNEGGYTTAYAVQLAGSTAPASEEIRDVTIDRNEFCGFTTGIRADGKASGTKNVYRITITANHTLPFGGVGTGALLAAVNCREISTHGNFLNGLALASASGKGIACVTCEHMRISGNYFANYAGATVELSSCTDSDVALNKFVDCATTGTSYVVIALYGATSARNYFRNNVFRQTSASYGQYGILEDTGVNYTFSFDNQFDGFVRPHTKVGANSIMRRTEYASAAPTSGSYYVGDIVWNTAPSAGGAPGWVCTTAGVGTAVFKAMANLAA